MRLYSKILITLFYLFWFNSVLSQIKSIDLPEGQYAFSLQEDSEGNIWVGLSDGNTGGDIAMVKNDTLVIKSGDKRLPSGSYHTSIKLTDGSLMFGGNIIANGKPCLVWVTPFSIDTIQVPISLTNPFVNTIALVNNREIWIGSANGLLVNRYGNWSSYTTYDGLPHNFVTAIEQDFRGVVWIGTELGLAYYVDKQFHIVEQTSRAIANVTHFFTDNKGYLWCGSRFSSEGISVYNGKEWETFSGRHGLEDNSTSIFFQDSKGTLWAGSCYHRTRGGLTAFNGKEWEAYSSPEHLAKPCVDAITEDADGNIWFGGSLPSRKGEGITIYDGKTWHKISKTHNFPANRVIAMFCDSKGRVWVSSMEGLFVVDSINLNQ